MEKLIIEAAINEQAPKSLNPRVPYTPEECAREALEAAEAGAAIIHFHARDPQTGALLHPGIEPYTEAMSLIRARNKDVILYPTYSSSPTPQERFSHVEALARHKDIRLDFATIDLGAENLGELHAGESQFRADHVRSVTHQEARYFFDLCHRLGVRYSIGVREIGQVRVCIAYRRLGWIKNPILFKLILSDYHQWGMPPGPAAIETYFTRMMPPDIPYRWMSYVYGPSHSKMCMFAVSQGAHVRTGLGDNPVLDGQRLSNAQQVDRVVKMARTLGREVATPNEARAILDKPARMGT
jgi:3-keto-5-aminohexanoate cleavage enzyme